MAYTPKVYSPDMTEKQARAFLKRQGMGQQEINTAVTLDPATGKRQIDLHQTDLTSEAESLEKKKDNKRARRALSGKAPTPTTPTKSPDRPLSREAISSLADYGISGLRTYDEAFSHLESYAKGLGYDYAPTKRNTSTEVTDEAEQTNARLAAKSQPPKISGDDAALIDQAHTLHVITKGMAVHSSTRGSLIQPSHTNFTPSEEHSKVVKESTRPDYTPRSGRPLISLPAVPVPMTEGMKPGQVRYRRSQYNKELKERTDLMTQLSTESRERSTRPVSSPAPMTSVESNAPAPTVNDFDPYAAAGNMSNLIARSSADALRSNLQNEWRGSMGYKEDMFTTGRTPYSYPEPKKMLSDMGRTPKLSSSRNDHFSVGHSKGSDQPLNMWEWMMPKDD
jgi:hypothetical protein